MRTMRPMPMKAASTCRVDRCIADEGYQPRRQGGAHPIPVLVTSSALVERRLSGEGVERVAFGQARDLRLIDSRTPPPRQESLAQVRVRPVRCTARLGWIARTS